MVLLSAPALAQAQGPFFRIQAEDADGKTITRDLGSEQLHFNVSVNPSTDSALSERFSIRLDVTMEPASLPNGFGAILSAPELESNACPSERHSCSVVVEPSTRVHFVVTVTNTVTDPDAPGVEITLKYKSTPSFSGSPPDPITAALIPAMSQTHEAQAKGSVGLKLDASEQVVSLVRRYPLIVLAAAGGMLALGVVLVRKRKGGLRVETEAPIQEVLPGRGASFPVLVTNEGGQKASLGLTTSEVPPGWSAILPVDRIELGPNESTTIWLTLKAPAVAHPGEHIQVSFVATSPDGTSAESLVEAVVVERYGAGPATSGPGPAEAQPGEPVAQARVAHVAPKRRRA